MLLEPSLAIVAIERDMLSEVWEARNAIETETARLAALRRTEDDLNALTAITSPRQAMGLPPTKRITA
jgi:DNA-binding FadR family transcriptional regulator